MEDSRPQVSSSHQASENRGRYEDGTERTRKMGCQFGTELVRFLSSAQLMDSIHYHSPLRDIGLSV